MRYKNTRRGRKKLFPNLIVIFFTVVVIGFLATVGIFAWYAKDLPNPAKVQRKEGFSTIIYDRSGELLYDIFADQNRIPVDIEDTPRDLKNATVAIEDRDFYKHEGYSTRGMMRAFLQILIFRNLQGGSTLTQQLVKNVLLTSERTLPRKIKEFILAVQIEQKYSKDEILQMYLNEAPYGGTAWGVAAGAQYYFGKETKDLNLVESAILAGFPQRPSVYSPFSSEPKAYIARTENVLRRMRENGYINKNEEEKAKEELESIKFKNKEENFKAPHFVMYVKKELEEKLGQEMVSGGGLKVTTTLNLKLQEKAEEILKAELEKIASLKVGNGAVVVLDPQTGEILAHVDSKDYHDDANEGKFDVATQGLRQPGSAIKPITYATAFEKGYTTPATLIMDTPAEFPGGEDGKPYIPVNYDGKFRGPVQLRFALGNSINIPAVKVLALTGLKNVLKTGYEMGLTTLEPTSSNMNRLGLSLTLGGGEVRLIDLTSAFAVFAAGGIRSQPIAILEIEDSKGNKIYENKKTSGIKVISPEVSFLISHILSDNEARRDVFGPNSWLNIPGKTVAVKTGTTNDKKDNWTVGFTKEVVVGVWVGNNDNSSMDQKLASGVTGAAPIWQQIMRQALSEYSDGIIEKPENVAAVTIDALGGGLPKEGEQTRTEYFIKGTEPINISPIYQKLKLSRRESGKLASDDEIRVGDYDEKDYIVFSEDDPLSTEGTNKWQEGINKWLEGMSDFRYHPPKEKSGIVISEEKPTPTPLASPALSPTPESDE